MKVHFGRCEREETRDLKTFSNSQKKLESCCCEKGKNLMFFHIMSQIQKKNPTNETDARKIVSFCRVASTDRVE